MELLVTRKYSSVGRREEGGEVRKEGRGEEELI